MRLWFLFGAVVVLSDTAAHAAPSEWRFIAYFYGKPRTIIQTRNQQACAVEHDILWNARRLHAEQVLAEAMRVNPEFKVSASGQEEAWQVLPVMPGDVTYTECVKVYKQDKPKLSDLLPPSLR